MGYNFSFGWEIGFIKWLQSITHPIFTSLALFFTKLGEIYALIVILGIVYWCVSKRAGKSISLAVIGSMMFGTLIKSAVLRRRPYFDNEEVKVIRAAYPEKDVLSPTEQGYSFPSLHATMSAATYGTLARCFKKTFFTVLAFVLPLLIGLSRPYLGVHYPTDVLCGWALGAVCVFLLGLLEHKFGSTVTLISMLAVGVIGFFYCRDNEFYSCYGITLGLLFGFLFEEKFVNFKMPTKWWQYIVRPLLGALVFAIISTVLKLPVTNTALSADHPVILAYRLFRYALSVFVTVGIYPLCFKFKI